MDADVKKLLVEKFENDMKKRTWFFRILLVVDQLFNVILWNGSQDETISSHISRRMKNGKATWLDKSICWGLKKISSKHCKKSLGE